MNWLMVKWLLERMRMDFRSLPSVDRLLSEGRIRQFEALYAHSVMLSLVRQYLDQVRLSIGQGQSVPSFDQMVEEICNRAQETLQPSLRPVINATGVILHTNLGRA